MSFGSILRALLFPAAFIIGGLPLIGWFTRGVPPREFLGVLVAMPIVFVCLMGLAALLWMRPDNREEKSLTGTDIAVVLVSWALWIVASFIPQPNGGFAMAIALVVTLLAIVYAWRKMTTTTAERIERATATRRASAAAASAGGTQETTEVSPGVTLYPADASQAAAHGNSSGQAPYAANRAPGPEPEGPFDESAPEGSTRTGPGARPRSSSTSPGANFGSNKAPANPDFDPTRPVRGANTPSVGEDAEGTGDVFGQDGRPGA